MDVRYREIQRDSARKHLEVPVVGSAPSSSAVIGARCCRSSCRSSARPMPPTSTCGPAAHAGQFELFLHAFDGTEVEQRLRGRGGAGSTAATASSSTSSSRRARTSQELFCPGTMLNPQRFQRTELSVFTFGMAHKIRVPLYRRLRDLLEATGQSYSVYVSTALHENTSFDGSFVVRFEELQSIFNGQVYFMGYLSDTAVFNHLMDCTFLAAFFEKGLRANNTTVNAAMEVGCAVITNLDEHSPGGPRRT